MHKKRKIGYLGPEGTFTQQAAEAVFQDRGSARFQMYGTIQECLSAIKNKTLDYAVVPIENSIGGSIRVTLDGLVHELNAPIQGEIQLPISYELLANDGQVNNASYTMIYGHPQALKQCDYYLSVYYKNTRREATESSAMAAQIVAEKPSRCALALGNRLTRHIYDLTAIDRQMENNQNNTTRFIILGNEAIPLSSEKIKSTMVVTFPGNDLMVLQNVLGVLKALSIQPLKIESIPTKRELGEYVFIIDVNTTAQKTAYNQAINDIQVLHCNVRDLGSYPWVTLDESGVRHVNQ